MLNFFLGKTSETPKIIERCWFLSSKYDKETESFKWLWMSFQYELHESWGCTLFQVWKNIRNKRKNM